MSAISRTRISRCLSYALLHDCLLEQATGYLPITAAEAVRRSGIILSLACEEVGAQIYLGLRESTKDGEEFGIVFEHRVSFRDTRNCSLTQMRVRGVVQCLQQQDQLDVDDSTLGYAYQLSLTPLMSPATLSSSSSRTALGSSTKREPNDRKAMA